jgi:hypothetical protein
VTNEETIRDLKAKAYDTLAQIEALQVQLRQLNQAIAREFNGENQRPAIVNEPATLKP